MGSCGSRAATSNHIEEPIVNNEARPPKVRPGALRTYRLNNPVVRVTFWRSDPTAEEEIAEHRDNPKDRAIIEGLPFIYENQDWLRCHRLKQPGEDIWIDAPVHASLPFRLYGDNRVILYEIT